MTTRITGTNSGLDVDTLVKAGLANYQTKIDKETQNQKVMEYQQTQYKEIMTSASDFWSKYLDNTKSDSFLRDATYTTINFKSGNDTKVTAKGFAGADLSDYSVNVSQLAEKASTTFKKSEFDAISTKKSVLSVNIGDKYVYVDIVKDSKNETDFATTVRNLNEALNKKGLDVSAKYSEFSKGLTLQSGKLGGDVSFKAVIQSDITEEEIADKTKTFDKTKYAEYKGKYAKGVITKGSETHEFNNLTVNKLVIDNVQFDFKGTTMKTATEADAITPATAVTYAAATEKVIKKSVDGKNIETTLKTVAGKAFSITTDGTNTTVVEQNGDITTTNGTMKISDTGDVQISDAKKTTKINKTTGEITTTESSTSTQDGVTKVITKETIVNSDKSIGIAEKTKTTQKVNGVDTTTENTIVTAISSDGNTIKTIDGKKETQTVKSGNTETVTTIEKDNADNPITTQVTTLIDSKINSITVNGAPVSDPTITNLTALSKATDLSQITALRPIETTINSAGTEITRKIGTIVSIEDDNGKLTTTDSSDGRTTTETKATDGTKTIKTVKGGITTTTTKPTSGNETIVTTDGATTVTTTKDDSGQTKISIVNGLLTTEIIKDKAGNIKSTTTTEKDGGGAVIKTTIQGMDPDGNKTCITTAGATKQITVSDKGDNHVISRVDANNVPVAPGNEIPDLTPNATVTDLPHLANLKEENDGTEQVLKNGTSETTISEAQENGKTVLTTTAKAGTTQTITEQDSDGNEKITTTKENDISTITKKNGSTTEVLVSDAVDLHAEVGVTDLKDKIVKFVDDYNKLIEGINKKLWEDRDKDYLPLTDEQKKSMTDTQIEAWEKKAQTGLLRKDSDLERAVNEMKSAMASMMSGTGLTLESIGVAPVRNYTTRNGMLSVDGDKLEQALKDNGGNVKDLFTRLTSKDGSDKGGTLTQLSSIINSEFKKSDSSLSKKAGIIGTSTETTNALSKGITDKKKYIKQLQSQYTTRETALYNKYSQLEKSLESLKSQQSSLSQLLGQ